MTIWLCLSKVYSLNIIAWFLQANFVILKWRSNAFYCWLITNTVRHNHLLLYCYECSVWDCDQRMKIWIHIIKWLYELKTIVIFPSVQNNFNGFHFCIHSILVIWTVKTLEAHFAIYSKCTKSHYSMLVKVVCLWFLNSKHRIVFLIRFIQMGRHIKSNIHYFKN